MSREVWVASKNPVKIAAAEKAFQQVFPGEEFTFRGISVESGVPDQPMGIPETLDGAINRVNNLVDEDGAPAYYVGMEGGIYRLEDNWFAFAWMYVRSAGGKTGKAMTGFFPLPGPVIQLLEEGLELGDAIDSVFSTENYKQKGGAVGILTHDLIDRTDYYIHAMVLALIPFIN
jgi:inosine/xanthosine triphosphatase